MIGRSEKTGKLKNLKIELLQYTPKGKLKSYASFYTVEIGDVNKELLLRENKNMTLTIE